MEKLKLETHMNLYCSNVGGILLCLSTGAHRGWYDFHDSVQMLVESVVSCPQSNYGSLVRYCQLSCNHCP
jgi:hypothetical protein